MDRGSRGAPPVHRASNDQGSPSTGASDKEFNAINANSLSFAASFAMRLPRRLLRCPSSSRRQFASEQQTAAPALRGLRPFLDSLEPCAVVGCPTRERPRVIELCGLSTKLRGSSDRARCSGPVGLMLSSRAVDTTSDRPSRFSQRSDCGSPRAAAPIPGRQPVVAESRALSVAAMSSRTAVAQTLNRVSFICGSNVGQVVSMRFAAVHASGAERGTDRTFPR